ncbi:hypothetical protein [Burkholderia ubonensis]|uniref:hypothetical protein n=1 Tax=Burkholderia ubonensis TaxID=101571 RepID=UPI000B2F54A6|nr:hypothetical protein [Burkholderia ubonensis]
MNTSMHSVSDEVSATRQTICGKFGGYVGAEVVSDVTRSPMMRLPTLVRTPFPKAPKQVLPDDGAPDDQGLPPTGTHVACSDSEPRFVRFITGPDLPIRRERLQLRLAELATGCRHTLLMLRKPDDLGAQLRAAIWTATLRAQFPERSIFIGIDGIDQRLTSPRSVAAQLATLVNIGATIICAVDGRYSDAHLLTFHLRILGITVVREGQCSSSVTEIGGTPRRFPTVHTPALTTYAYRKHADSFTQIDVADGTVPDKRPKSKRCRLDECAARFAAAYCNPFAISRLLAERKW